jgi:hypothetical protein
VYQLNRCLLACLAGIALILPAGVHAALTAEHVFATLKPEMRKQLQTGEIVTLVQPKQETSDSGLAVSLAVIVPANLDKTLATFRSLNMKDDATQHRTTRQISGNVRGDGSSPAFADIGFTADEKEEVKKLLQAEPGDDFNFSKEELAWVRQAAGSGVDPAKAAAGVMRRVLESRYLAYRKAGLAGLPPYARRGGEQVNPGAELAATTEAMPLLRKELPDFYQAYRNYPQVGAKGLQHRFFWDKKTVEGRPMFSLRHEMVQLKPDGATIGNREFYISNNLNTLQVAIALLPHGTQTLVVMANQTYTDKVSGSGHFVAVRVGRNIVESNIKPLFEQLQKTLGRAKPLVAGAAAP